MRQADFNLVFAARAAGLYQGAGQARPLAAMTATNLLLMIAAFRSRE
jgi:hypothetical protein